MLFINIVYHCLLLYHVISIPLSPLVAATSQSAATAAKRQYHYAHTQIEWRHESSQEAQVSEFYLENFESSVAQDQLSYYQYYQIHHQHHPNHLLDQQQIQLQQQHQQNSQIEPHQSQYDQQQPNHHHHHPHEQRQHYQQQQQQHFQQQHQHLMYAAQISSDEHDFTAAQQYYLESRPASSCNPIDSPSTLLMVHTYQAREPTCRTVSAAAASNLNTQASGSEQAAGPSGNVPNLSQYNNNKQSHNSNVESFPISAQRYNYESSLMAAIRHYWREISGLCLASAIFLNWLFVAVKRRLISSSFNRNEYAAFEAIIQRSTITGTAAANGATRVGSNAAATPTTVAKAGRTLSKDTNSGGSAHDSAFEENASPLGLDGAESTESSSIDGKSSLSVVMSQQQVAVTPTTTTTTVTTLVDDQGPTMRQRSSTLKAEPISIPLPKGHNPSLSASLSNSLSNNSEYISRYSSDFDSIQRLGRGGFGIVFEAKNKIDDCHYAVKRICLPLEKEARERVMREVRALAKLDHAGIVRYYNAWLETPPDEWLKQHDAQLGIVHSKDGLSFPSTDGVYDRNETEEHGRKLGCNGGDSGGSSDLFGNNPFTKRRTNGYKLLRNHSSSPSLDIVFEGSGSIRVESENSTKKTNSDKQQKRRKSSKNSRKQNKKNGDKFSDSEDSEFIQFEPKNKNGADISEQDEDVDISISSHLTEPFSSSSSDSNNLLEDENQGQLRMMEARRRALIHQKELRQLNKTSFSENLQLEKVYLYIQMQLCRKDTLKDWLKTNCDTRDKTTIFDLFYQIVDAVEYVHSQDLIHRDLKPSNIFFSLDGTLKIGDFGLCRTKTNAGAVGSSLDLQEHVAESEVERGFEAVHTEQVGTQLYMSPEQLNGLSYNQKVDIFAMGLILLELLIPFRTQMQRVNVLFKARNNLYSDEFRNEHPKEHELVKDLLNRSPLKRPTATEIKQHDLLASAQLSQPVIERIYHRRRTISSNSSNE